jgi:membrane associated rhomboid family serine protease
MGLEDRDYYKEGYVDEFRLETMSVIVRLIILNVAVFLVDLIFGQGELKIEREVLALKAVNFAEPWMWWRFLTYGFAHDGVQHLVFNMIGLYFFGRELEYIVGKKELVTFYLTAIVFSAAAFAGLYLIQHRGIIDPNDKTTLLGASGGVMAVIIAFCVRFPLAPIIRFPFTLPAWMVGGLYVIGDLAGYMSPNLGLGPHTAYEAHLAGAFFAAGHWYFQLRLSSIFDNSWMGELKRRMRRMNSGLKVHRPSREIEPDTSDLEDQILAKVHEHGISSLTPKEKQILEEYSRRLRSRSD